MTQSLMLPTVLQFPASCQELSVVVPGLNVSTPMGDVDRHGNDIALKSYGLVPPAPHNVWMLVVSEGPQVAVDESMPDEPGEPAVAPLTQMPVAEPIPSAAAAVTSDIADQVR